jgi:hypothetical protein
MILLAPILGVVGFIAVTVARHAHYASSQKMNEGRTPVWESGLQITQ